MFQEHNILKIPRPVVFNINCCFNWLSKTIFYVISYFLHIFSKKSSYQIRKDIFVSKSKMLKNMTIICNFSLLQIIFCFKLIGNEGWTWFKSFSPGWPNVNCFRSNHQDSTTKNQGTGWDAIRIFCPQDPNLKIKVSLQNSRFSWNVLNVYVPKVKRMYSLYVFKT